MQSLGERLGELLWPTPQVAVQDGPVHESRLDPFRHRARRGQQGPGGGGRELARRVEQPRDAAGSNQDLGQQQMIIQLPVEVRECRCIRTRRDQAVTSGAE